MIPEDAIEILENLQGHMEETDFIDRCALDMAIEALKEQRPHGEWKVYSYCSDGFSYKCSLCERVINSGHWFEREEILSIYPYCHCGAKMIAVADPIKWYSNLGKKEDDDAADAEPDLEYIKIGDTIYTQDDDKQGWTGREENK